MMPMSAAQPWTPSSQMIPPPDGMSLAPALGDQAAIAMQSRGQQYGPLPPELQYILQMLTNGGETPIDDVGGPSLMQMLAMMSQQQGMPPQPGMMPQQPMGMGMPPALGQPTGLPPSPY